MLSFICRMESTLAMKLAIVHLSDIHFKARSDVGFRRREKLANTIRFSRSPEEKLLFVITGDIANKGLPSEYEVAANFFRQLFTELEIDGDSVIFIPGNHDCNFQNIGDLRPRLLSDIATQLGSLDEAGETVDALLQVQADFFRFQHDVTGKGVDPAERLYFARKLKFGDNVLEFRCFNSAWLSSKHEEPGSLGFPVSVIQAGSAKTDSDVVISMVHHPANWLHPSAYQDFRSAVQTNSDFLFTGHEHTVGGQVIAPFSGSNLIHFESGPYQPADSGESEFGILHLDLEQRSWKHEEFKWLAGAYKKVNDSVSQKLFDKSERAASLKVTATFLSQLTAPGTGFLHPRQQNLQLPDLYIYPDLKIRSISRKLRKDGDLPKEMASGSVPDTILNAKRVVIAGPTDSGKTSLSKMLFLHAYTRRGRSCVLLCGKSLKGKDPESTFVDALDEALDVQYGPGSSGQYSGLRVEDRVLVVDDWDEVRFNRAERSAILNRAASIFGCIILFADDIFLIEELSGRHTHAPLGEFEIADIRDFGFRLRGQLVRKWHALGNAYLEGEENFAREVAESTRVIDTTLGRNLLPSYPVNILTLLQTYDAGAGSQNIGLGSYGQVYEALITARLAKVSLKSIDIGTKITFLSRFAWRLFESHQQSLDETEWAELSDQYYSEYKVRIDAVQMRNACLDASIISEIETGYRFSYGYGYCYFVAKYFQENLADLEDGSARADLFERLKSLSERVYNQNNANIVIFYVFLTKDRKLINYVIANASKIFGDQPEFDFDSHVEFVNRVMEPPVPLQLPGGTSEENQHSYNQKRDEIGEQIEPRGDPSAEELQYSNDLAFEHKLVMGIRYLGLMGQILRNFPGSLKADTKLDLALESYSLGLRILGAVFTMTNRDSESLTKDIVHVLRTKMAFKGPEREVRTRAELIMAEILRDITFGLVKRVASAIGLSELEATYDDVADIQQRSVANRMIHLSIRLDHFSRYPKGEIENMEDLLSSNTFAYQTLRDLVLNDLYLFPRGYEIQQWAGSTLKMKVNLPGVRGSARKLLSGST
jgi:predicted MPP superfamily phosphohydrolase